VKYHVIIGDSHHEVLLEPEGAGVVASTDGQSRHLEVATLKDGRAYSVIMNGRSVDVGVEERGDVVDLLIGGRRYTVDVLGEREYLARSIKAAQGGGDTSVRAVMTGIVRDVLVAPGDVVTAGQVLFILEAMKMENEVKADVAGTVSSVHTEAGVTVEQGDLVIEIDATEA